VTTRNVLVAALIVGIAAATLGLLNCAGTSRVRSSTGPGAGFLTRAASLARPLREDFRLTPILSAGDTLVPNNPGVLPFVFAGRAGGLGARDRGDGTAEVYVSHDDAWLEGAEGSMVSRLVLDLRNSGVLAADFLLRPDRGYAAFAHAALLDSRVGFLRPQFVVNERGQRTRIPLVAAIDVMGERIQDLPWLGAMRHKRTISLPATGGKVLVVMTGGSTVQSADQLYLYVANSDTDILSGNGQLYVFRADANSVPTEAPFASRIRRGVPVGGAFVAVDPVSARSTAALEARVQQLRCLNFIRLEGLAVDRERLNAFYFTDRLGFGSSATVQTAAGGGRLYHMRLDAFDPTQVEELEVVLDSSEGDDLFRPSSIDTDERCVMIQEYPGAHGIHPSRILRYDLRARRLEAVAECAERDRRGRAKPRGVGGEWEPSGITNVSDLLGEDSWLFTVQAHTIEATQNSGRYGEAGQLLLLRGPRNPRAPSPRGSTTGGSP
jgi:hypothetical protein